MSWYHKGKTNLDFTEARDSEWQWHQLGCMQVCISFQTDNHVSTPTTQVFYRPDALPATQPTALKHRRQLLKREIKLKLTMLMRQLHFTVTETSFLRQPISIILPVSTIQLHSFFSVNIWPITTTSNLTSLLLLMSDIR